jgi:hypothetical protein
VAGKAHPATFSIPDPQLLHGRRRRRPPGGSGRSPPRASTAGPGDVGRRPTSSIGCPGGLPPRVSTAGLGDVGPTSSIGCLRSGFGHARTRPCRRRPLRPAATALR